jgi:hypothetical protein
LKRNRDDLTEGSDWTWHDTPEHIAAVMLRRYPDKAKRLGAALQQRTPVCALAALLNSVQQRTHATVPGRFAALALRPFKGLRSTGSS